MFRIIVTVLCLVMLTGAVLAQDALYVRGTAYYDGFDTLLQDLCLNVTISDTIPGWDILPYYDLVIVNSNDACNPTTAALLETYVTGGRGLVLIGGTPSFLGLPGISSWFGATGYTTSGGQALFVDNPAPFITELVDSDLLTDRTGSTSESAITGVTDPTTILGEWEDGSVFSFWNSVGTGRLLYLASMYQGVPLLDESNLAVFTRAGLAWAAGMSDQDHDSYPDQCDNCPTVANPSQADYDGNGTGDACCCGQFTGGYPGNTDCSPDGKRNLSDITRLIDAVYLSKKLCCCPSEWNVDGDEVGKTGLADITKLIDYVYIGKKEVNPCVHDIFVPTGSLVDYGVCKSDLFAKPLADYPSDQDCMVWQYDGTGELTLDHINAGFNCCPLISADINIEGSIITITEFNPDHPAICDCDCLFDLRYKFSVPPGEYRVIFEEPLRSWWTPLGYQEAGPVLETTIDLTAAPSGDFCVPRSGGPWGL